MKRTLLLSTLFLLYSFVLVAQEKGAMISNSEKFVEEPGRILEKEMVTMGDLTVKYNLQKQNMNVNTLVVKDLITGKAYSCLVLELIKKTKFAYVDPDEIAGFINMLKLIEDKYINSVRPNYTEIVYNTRGGTEAGCFFDQEKWVVFLRLDKSEKNTIIEIKTEDLSAFRKLMEKADGMIN